MEENTLNTEEVKEKIVEMIRTVFDPEIPVNIYDLGMIYNIDVQPDGKAAVTMTLTSPNCPVIESLPAEIEQKVRSVPGVTTGNIELVWDPPWTPDRMSEAAKLELGWM